MSIGRLDIHFYRVEGRRLWAIRKRPRINGYLYSYVTVRVPGYAIGFGWRAA